MYYYIYAIALCLNFFIIIFCAMLQWYFFGCIIYVKKILYSSILFLVLDSIWIMLFAQATYQTHLGEYLMYNNNTWQINYAACIFVYIVLIGGIALFPIEKAQDN